MADKYIKTISLQGSEDLDPTVYDIAVDSNRVFIGNQTLDEKDYMEKGKDYVTAGQKEDSVLGLGCTIEGSNNIASGRYCHAEGYNTTIADTGEYSHTEGLETYILGGASHAEGYQTKTYKNYSHAEGEHTFARGLASHAEGKNTSAYGDYSHAEGIDTYTCEPNTHAEGDRSSAVGRNSHAEGAATYAGIKFSDQPYSDYVAYCHAEGFRSTATGSVSHAEGNHTYASGLYSHSECQATSAIGHASHAEGYYTCASGKGSHAEGGYSLNDERGTFAYGDNTHAEGYMTTAFGDNSHAEGYKTYARRHYSHAEGYMTTAGGVGDYLCAHSEGQETKALGECSHVEGYQTTASGTRSHAEGQLTYAYGFGSHASGSATTAKGTCSFTAGQKTIATENNLCAVGFANVDTSGNLFEVGNGSYEPGGTLTRSNAFSVSGEGIVKAAGTITASTTADYAENFELADGNINNEDRVGHFVTFNNENKIRIATNEDDYILGVVSGAPFVLGNGDCDVLNGMFIRDNFGRIQYESAPKYKINEETGKEELVFDENGNQVYEGIKPIINPDYDSSQEYISRAKRSELAPIGMLGVLSVYEDGTCIVNGYCTVSINGIATKADNNSINKYRVIKRKADNIIQIVFR